MARTKGAHRKHFFREFTNGVWGPWTQMMIDPEDMPVTPIVWNGRLLCCWLKAVKQTQGSAPQISPTSTSTGTGTSTPTTLANLTVSDLNTFVSNSTAAAASGSVTAQVALCWAEYYNGKWQPAKTSDVSLPTTDRRPSTQSATGSFEAVRNQLRIVPGQFTGTNPDLAGSTGPGVHPRLTRSSSRSPARPGTRRGTRASSCTTRTGRSASTRCSSGSLRPRTATG